MCWLTRCNTKISVIFKFRESSKFDFRNFFSVMLVYRLLYYVDISHFGLSVCLLSDNKVSHVVSFDFLIFDEMDHRNRLQFCKKFKINAQARTFVMLTMTFGECTMSRTQV